MRNTSMPDRKRVLLPSAGLGERRATWHVYDHSEVVRIERKHQPVVEGVTHFYRCEETGSLRRTGFS